MTTLKVDQVSKLFRSTVRGGGLTPALRKVSFDLRPGEVIESSWANGEDLPLSSGTVQLAWTEFEVVDSRLAVRVTRLA